MRTATVSETVRILGIDPGLRITGFGVIDRTGQKLSYVASGCIKTNDTLSLPERIKTIIDGIAEVVGAYHPHQAAIEKVFVNVNPQSTLLLGQARGAAIAALVGQNLPVAEYTALQLKQAVVGQVSTHCPTRFATPPASFFVVNAKNKSDAPGRPSGVSLAASTRSTPASQSQPMTLVAYPVAAITAALTQC